MNHTGGKPRNNPFSNRNSMSKAGKGQSAVKGEKVRLES